MGVTVDAIRCISLVGLLAAAGSSWAAPIAYFTVTLTGENQPALTSSKSSTGFGTATLHDSGLLTMQIEAEEHVSDANTAQWQYTVWTAQQVSGTLEDNLLSVADSTTTVVGCEDMPLIPYVTSEACGEPHLTVGAINDLNVELEIQFDFSLGGVTSFISPLAPELIGDEDDPYRYGNYRYTLTAVPIPAVGWLFGLLIFGGFAVSVLAPQDPDSQRGSALA